MKYILTRIKSIFLCIFNLLKYYLCFYFCLFITIFSQQFIKFNDDFGFSVALILSTLCFILLLKIERKSPIKYLNIHKLEYNFSFFLILIFSISLSLFCLNIGIIFEKFTSPDLYSNSRLYFWSLLHIIIIAPICEEIFFRGIIFTKLNTVLRLPITLLIQGLLFGFMHGGLSGHLIQSLLATISGIIYALIYYYTANLTIPILIHICYNTLIVIFNFFPFIFLINPFILLFMSLLGFILVFKFKRHVHLNINHKIKH